MLREQFDTVLKSLVNVFGEKAFTKARQERIFKICQHLDRWEFMSVVDEMLDNFRYPPLPKDFREAVMRRKRFAEEDNSPDTIGCERCLDSGLAEAHDDDICFSAFIRCNCLAGKNSVWKKLPEVTTAVLKSHRLSPPRLDYWKPGNGENLWTKAQLWKQQIQLSEEYWSA